MTEDISSWRTFLSRRGGGIYRFLVFSCISIGSLSIFSSLTIPKWNDYQEVRFSKWTERQVDYSTNMPVTAYYAGGSPRYLRSHEWDGFLDRIGRGDTLTVGIDYYALFPISRSFLPEGLVQKHVKDLLNGKVIYLRAYREGEYITWRKD